MINDDDGFFPLPEGYSLEPKPLTDDQIAELTGLFRTSRQDEPSAA
jgi:hypothetical protein